MSNLAEQQTEFKEETVAEAIECKLGLKIEDNDGFDIEIVDDTPEEDRDKPRRAENVEPQIPK